MRVAKWGNSLAARLPSALVEELQLKEGDEVELRSGARETFEVAKPLTVEAAIADLGRFRGRLPPGFKFARALAARYGFSWSDAVIVASALEGNCSRLIPADVHDG